MTSKIDSAYRPERKDLTANDVLRLLDYDAAVGLFYWRRRTREQFQSEEAFESFNANNAGRIAGTETHRGMQITIRFTAFPAAELVWLVETGAWPEHGVAFADGDCFHTHFSNLRPAPPPAPRGKRVGRKRKGGNGVAWDRYGADLV
jgi:hypothetical protein